MIEINVTPWGTREALQNDPGAPLHDCLWEIAQEQAVLQQMKESGESWETTGPKVSPQEIQKQLDTVCDDNGFRRLDGGGSGRDPNLIHPGEKIKVRIDPTKLENETAAQWLETVPGVPTLPAGTKTALAAAHDVKGMNPDNLAKLGGSPVFRSLDEKQQQQLLAVYGAPGKNLATAEVDKIVGAPANEDNQARLKVVGTPGFFMMDDGAQKIVLDRYTSDAQFRGALNDIANQESFKNKNSTEQAHALDILGRYSERKGEGYGEQPEDKRKAVLVTLYNDILAKPEFNLNYYGAPGQRENGDQRQKIEDFANGKAGEIGGNQAAPAPAPGPSPNAPALEDQYWD